MSSRRAFILILLPALALVGLVLSDRHLRGYERMDLLVATGQTGFSWIDSALPGRLAAHNERKKLLADLHKTTSPEKRIQANYALFHFELKQQNEGSSLAKEALTSIIKEGKNHSQTIPAYRHLIRAAKTEERMDDLKTLLPAYAGAIQNLPPDPENKNILLEAWRFSVDGDDVGLQFQLLKRIHADYPVSMDALPAYEALALMYRQRKDPSGLASVEDSIEKTRDLMVRCTWEQDLVRQLQTCLQNKDVYGAEKQYLSMIPGLSPEIDYGSLIAKLVGLQERQGMMAHAMEFFMKAAAACPPEKLQPAGRVSFLTTLALLYSERGQYRESLDTLNMIASGTPQTPWQMHAQARLWAQKREGTSPVTCANAPNRGTLPLLDDKTSLPIADKGWNQLLPPPLSTLNQTPSPSTFWRASWDATNLHVQFLCAEPTPEAMLARHHTRDAPIAEDDCVELFITPLGTDARYFRMACNSLGTLEDSLHIRNHFLVPPSYESDAKWSSMTDARAGKIQGGWHGSLVIPWKELGIRPSDSTCFFNMRRIRHANGKPEYASWSTTNAFSHPPSSMGLLLFKK